jgi:hypothetical protein
LLLGSVVHGHLARGFHLSSWALGLVGFPALLLALQWLRARRTPTRLNASWEWLRGLVVEAHGQVS